MLHFHVLSAPSCTSCSFCSTLYFMFCQHHPVLHVLSAPPSTSCSVSTTLYVMFFLCLYATLYFQSDELMCQKKLRSDVSQLEDQLAQVRREYELLRMEFEQTLAANEQTGGCGIQVIYLRCSGRSLNGSKFFREQPATLAEVKPNLVMLKMPAWATTS